VDAVAAEYVGRYEGYTALSPTRARDFEQMLEYAKAHGIRVVMFITVIHPRVVRVIEPHNYPQRYAEVKALLEQLSAKYGAPVYDFSRVEAFGGSNDWFYDGSHVDERNADLMTRKMLEGTTPEGKPDAVR
jgi:lysophospholipase L1-like esterase